MVKTIFVDENENELEIFPTTEYKIHIGIDSDPSGEHSGYYSVFVDLSMEDAETLMNELKNSLEFLKKKKQEEINAEK